MAQDIANTLMPTGLTNGRNTKVTGTNSAGAVTFHTATNTAGELDEVWMYANNTSGSDVLLTVECGGTINPDDYLKISIRAQQGDQLVIAGKRYNGGVVIKAFAATADVINLSGNVNRITQG